MSCLVEKLPATREEVARLARIVEQLATSAGHHADAQDARELADELERTSERALPTKLLMDTTFFCRECLASTEVRRGGHVLDKCPKCGTLAAELGWPR